MEVCPICGNTVGFVCGTCIQCGYNHISHSYDWIEVNTSVLERILPPETLEYLVCEHERYKKKRKV